ncbi:hypothetical protein OGATHE_004124 [Ogataea polymorpha]|uniref:Uncharacterized protein n=1 Tax=Ogataea polymorpha TaxID=460523 RepID=A0A9P8P4D7_9ASCO|nr:hypothetical protein OGATHE_004124 [Ogataea polymorpha]
MIVVISYTFKDGVRFLETSNSARTSCWSGFTLKSSLLITRQTLAAKNDSLAIGLSNSSALSRIRRSLVSETSSVVNKYEMWSSRAVGTTG